MKTFLRKLLFAAASCLLASTACPTQLPWENGKLKVSDNGRYLMHENGTPFFWLGDTGWLMPERLNRDEVSFSSTVKARTDTGTTWTTSSAPPKAKAFI